MDLRYSLTGRFVEACNCTVICPCWVDDTPDEDHCAGLFAWTFDEGSAIEGHDVSGRSVVSVTVHGDRRRDNPRDDDQAGHSSSSAIYVDAAVDQVTAQDLVAAFSGHGGGPLADLAEVTGDVVSWARASVTVTDEKAGWTVRVASDGNQLVRAEGSPATFDGSTNPLELRHTALAKELGIGAEPVTASKTRVLLVDVLALPGAPVDAEGRSGMTGRFAYQHSGGLGDDDEPPDHDDE